MSYENAPATKLLATHCAACGRPLVDALSVEIGMGPDCRKKYGYNEVVKGLANDPADRREQANRLVHRVAVHQDGLEAASAAAELRALGFERLADRLLERTAPVRVCVTDEGRLEVRAPYNEMATDMFRRIPGRRWDRERKANLFPSAARVELWDALCIAYRGLVLLGPGGLRVLGGGNERAEVRS